MLKAYDVMTHTPASCSPDATATEVARLMRDRDIGTVLVMEDNKLRGIVTDRDLALHALTDSADFQTTPVRKYMSKKVITGEPDWSVERIAKIMADNQIRRLPIVQNKQVVGIVSLGDVARHLDQAGIVATSLQAVSTPRGMATLHRSGLGRSLLGLALAAMATSLVAWLSWNRSGQAFRKQVMNTAVYHTTRETLKQARGKAEKVASSKAARNLRRDVSRQVNATFNDLSAQLPTITYKPPRAKRGLFG